MFHKIHIYGSKQWLLTSTSNTANTNKLVAQYTANELTFTNQTLNSGTYGTAYTSNAFTGASNGTGSYTYTIKSGAPTGTTINSTNRTISLASTVAANTYNIVVTATDNSSNKTKDATMTIVINQISVVVTATNQGKDWDGTALTADDTCSISGQLSGHTVTCSSNTGSQIDVGSSAKGVGTVTIKDASNNDVTSNYSVSKAAGLLTVNPVAAVITCQNKTYNGESQTIATCTGCTGTLTNASQTNAGTYTVSGTADSNHTTPTSKDCSIERSKTATTGSCRTLYYNGSSQTLASGATSAYYSNNSGTAVGTYTVTVTANTNYAFSDGTLTKTLSCTINQCLCGATGNHGLQQYYLSYNGTYYCFEGTRDMGASTCKGRGSYWINGVCYYYRHPVGYYCP